MDRYAANPALAGKSQAGAPSMFRLFAAQGQRDVAQRHENKAHAIAQTIEKSMEPSGLEARLNVN